MKRILTQTVPVGWRLPFSADYDFAVRQFAEAARLADSGQYLECLELNGEVRKILNQLSISPEFRHSGHIADWVQKWRGLEGQCHRALGQQSADKSRESLGKDLEEASQFLTVYKAHGDRYPTGTCLQLFEQGVAQYSQAVVAWHNRTPRERVLAELQESKHCFERLREIVPYSQCYCDHLKACMAAIELISDVSLPRDPKVDRSQNQRTNEPEVLSLLKNVADQSTASLPREAAIAACEAIKPDLEIKDLIIEFRKCLLALAPVLLVLILLKNLTHENFYLQPLITVFGPLLMGLWLRSSWSWISEPKRRPILKVGHLALGVAFSIGIMQLPWYLAVISGLGFAVSMALSTLWLFRLEGMPDGSPSSLRLAAHLARLQRQADDLSVDWARWIRRELPSAIATLLTEGDDAIEQPRLRFWLDWMPASYVYAKEARGVLLLCGQVILEFTEFVIETMVPPRRIAPIFRQRDRANVCTSWAVLLRCPLHLPRGDDVAVAG